MEYIDLTGLHPAEQYRQILESVLRFTHPNRRVRVVGKPGGYVVQMTPPVPEATEAEPAN